MLILIDLNPVFLSLFSTAVDNFLLFLKLISKQTGYRETLLPLIIAFNMIGKFGITGSFGIVFLYAPEIFPTTLRLTIDFVPFCEMIF